MDTGLTIQRHLVGNCVLNWVSTLLLHVQILVCTQRWNTAAKVPLSYIIMIDMNISTTLYTLKQCSITNHHNDIIYCIHSRIDFDLTFAWTSFVKCNYYDLWYLTLEMWWSREKSISWNFVLFFERVPNIRFSNSQMPRSASNVYKS